MFVSKIAARRGGVVFCLMVLAAIAAAAALPFWFGVKASASHSHGGRKTALPNYDIRFDEAKNDETLGFLDHARTSMGKTDASVADLRARSQQGEAELRTRLPHVKF